MLCSALEKKMETQPSQHSVEQINLSYTFYSFTGAFFRTVNTRSNLSHYFETGEML